MATEQNLSMDGGTNTVQQPKGQTEVQKPVPQAPAPKPNKNGSDLYAY